jgi:hypothetical protein
MVLTNVSRVFLDGYAGAALPPAGRTLLALMLAAHVIFGVCLKLFFFTFSFAN